MAYETSNTQNKSNNNDQPKAQAYINLRGICNKTGEEFKLQGIRHFGVPLNDEQGNLAKSLIEQAKKNGGTIEVTLKATVNAVSDELDISAFGEF